MLVMGEMEVLELVQPWWCTYSLWEMVGQDQQALQGLTTAVWFGQGRRASDGAEMRSCTLLWFCYDVDWCRRWRIKNGRIFVGPWK